ncbi:choice-of-anchor D domain-containing protein [Chiayiivirga flava]|uniref:Abnormal spindle-like microcephaly-associated protein ASH domain-containing protein n=1 Tax=Chiayiivirga flava TaxID=659595 RepID=A0A7W8FZD6_9GAMM|nr:choice-of-anchor D domain-containing protein [Chiayiivirga flava]MBB5208026.1 hypothetical protein [Chiayiivirga flava]
MKSARHRWGAMVAAGLVAWCVGAVLPVQAGTPPAAQVELVTPDMAFANVGRAVAVDGDTALVSSPFANVGADDGAGAVYVFVRSGGAWTQQAVLAASVAEPFSGFGSAVAIDGDTAVVGAPSATGVVDFAGAVYVFTRSGTTWTQQARLVAADGEGFSDFARTLAVDGDSIVVGAPSMFLGNQNVVGAAYVFARSGGTWTQQQKLLASDGGEFDSFGNAVAIDGDRVVIGAHQADVGSALFAGAAYAFERSGGTWTQTQKITPGVPTEDDTFGSSVALDGDSVVIGARQPPLLDDGGTGRAFVFVDDGTAWTQQAELMAADPAIGDEFGAAVGIAGDQVIVSAPFNGATPGVDLEAGAVYVFQRAMGVWTQQSRIRAVAGRQGEHMGDRVDLSGITAIVGASEATVGDNAFQGKAYIFTLGLPQLQVAPLAMDFGAVAVGASSAPQTLTVRNVGTADLFSGAITLGGADAANFAIVGDACGGERLGPAQSCVAQVAFTPDAIRSYAAQVIAPGSAGVAFVDATGEGVEPPPQIAVTPNPIEAMLPQDASATLPITVSHPGTSGTLAWELVQDATPPARRLHVLGAATAVSAALPDGALDFAGFRRSPARTGAGTPGPNGLPPLGQTLTHSTSDAIVVGNSLVCGNNDTGTTNANQFLRVFTLADFGIDSDFAVDSVQFAVEDVSVATTVTVNLYLLDGTDLRYFAMQRIATADVALQPQSTAYIDVPLPATVPADATLVFEVAIPDMEASAGNYAPGSNAAGQTAPSYVAATACGADDPVDTASIGAPDMHLVMSVTGTSAAPAPDCTLPTWLDLATQSGTLAPGASQSVDLQFDTAGLPQGTVTAQLCFASNAEDALYLVPVTLDVTATPQLSVDTTSLDFGSVVVGVQSDARTVVVSNPGTVAATIGTAAIDDAAFAIVADTCSNTSLAAGDTCNIDIVFAPQATGAATGTLQLPSDAADSPATVALAGNGLPAGIAIFADGFEGLGD